MSAQQYHYQEKRFSAEVVIVEDLSNESVIEYKLKILKVIDQDITSYETGDTFICGHPRKRKAPWSLKKIPS